jgi:hypothetical protein
MIASQVSRNRAPSSSTMLLLPGRDALPLQAVHPSIPEEFSVTTPRSEPLFSIYLNVPFAEKEEAKRLGARWDETKRQWYVPSILCGNDASISDFRRWFPSVRPPVRLAPDDTTEDEEIIGGSTEDDRITLWAPLFLARNTQRCWQCGDFTQVFSLGASVVDYDDDELRRRMTGLQLVTYLGQLPELLKPFFERACPSYKMVPLNSARAREYVNHCERCQSRIGDGFIHSRSGGGFFPYRAESVELHFIADFPDPACHVSGAISWCAPNLINHHARRIITSGSPRF